MKVSDKSLIAKLLATENITVVQGNAKTASFDVESRVLTLPLWLEDIESFVEDHMTGHEVGHALFTPLDGWHDAVCSKGSSYKSFLNVVEDARIEKLIQRKYPGFRPVFVKSYRKLFADGFFGSDIEEINRGSLIDRINTYFKCGGSYGVVFDESEQHWLEEISELETWEEVEELTDRLYGYAKEQEQEKQEQQQKEDSPQDSEEDSEEDNGFDNFELQDSEEDSEEESETVESDEFEDSEEDEEEDGISNGREGGQSEEDFTPAASDTDQQLRENIDRNISKNFDGRIDNFSIYNYDKNWKDYVRPYKDLIDEIEGNANMDDRVHHPDILKQASAYVYQDWRKNNMKSVNNMVKEFEMRKSAANYARGAVSKTGVLDTVKMNNYKMTDDIFKKVTIVPDGKNHGFIMFLDMSGSMHNIFHDTVCQTLLLVHFARQINVPFRVYGFSDSSYARPDFRVGDNNDHHPGIEKDTLLADINTTLIELFTDKMNKRDMMKVSGALLCQNVSPYNAEKFGYTDICDKVESCSVDWQVWNEVSVRGLMLGGTPLDASLLVGISAARRFKKDYQIDVLNTVFLTDGASHSCNVSEKKYDGSIDCAYTSPPRQFSSQRHTTIHFEGKSYLIDRKHSFSNRLHEVYQDATGSRTIGFYILKNGIGALRKEYQYSGKFIEDEQASAYNKDGYNATQLPGIDQQFYVPEKSLRTINNDMEEVTSSDSKAKVRSAFRKGASGSKKSRKMLVELAKAVA